MTRVDRCNLIRRPAVNVRDREGVALRTGRGVSATAIAAAMSDVGQAIGQRRRNDLSLQCLRPPLVCTPLPGVFSNEFVDASIRRGPDRLILTDGSLR